MTEKYTAPVDLQQIYPLGKWDDLMRFIAFSIPLCVTPCRPAAAPQVSRSTSTARTARCILGRMMMSAVMASKAAPLQ